MQQFWLLQTWEGRALFHCGEGMWLHGSERRVHRLDCVFTPKKLIVFIDGLIPRPPSSLMSPSVHECERWGGPSVGRLLSISVPHTIDFSACSLTWDVMKYPWSSSCMGMWVGVGGCSCGCGCGGGDGVSVSMSVSVREGYPTYQEPITLWAPLHTYV